MGGGREIFGIIEKFGKPQMPTNNFLRGESSPPPVRRGPHQQLP